MYLQLEFVRNESEFAAEYEFHNLRTHLSKNLGNAPTMPKLGGQ